MHLFFTDKEKQYIIRTPFNWSVSKKAPIDIQKSVNEKLKMLNNQSKQLGI